jgi:hypothetical protein
MRKRWAGLVACLKNMRSAYKVLLGRTEGTEDFDDVAVGGSIILK